MLGTSNLFLSNLGSWNGHWLSQILQISIDEFPIFPMNNTWKKLRQSARPENPNGGPWFVKRFQVVCEWEGVEANHP